MLTVLKKKKKKYSTQYVERKFDTVQQDPEILLLCLLLRAEQLQRQILPTNSTTPDYDMNIQYYNTFSTGITTDSTTVQLERLRPLLLLIPALLLL